MTRGRTVQQSGNVTVGHVTSWTTDGVVQDSGLGVTNITAAMFSNTPAALTRASIATTLSTVLPDTLVTSGYATAGDPGAGAIYTSVGASSGGPLAIQTSDGVWFNLVITGPVNVGWFGAVGDGATDCTAAIQAAIDAVHAAGGGIVYVPTGEFFISSTINLITGVLLVGSKAQDWATINDSICQFTWNGAASGTMLSLGQTYTGRVEGLTLYAAFNASVGIDMGAPIGSVFRDITINATVAGGSPIDAAMIAYLTGQFYPGPVQAPSALAGCTLENIAINPSSNTGFWGRGVTDCVWINPMISVSGSGKYCVLLEGDSAVADDDSDTTTWIGGLITSYSGATAVRMNAGCYGNNFYGGAVNNGDDSSLCFDVRDSSPGTCNCVFGGFDGPFQPSVALTNGDTPGFLRFIGTSWGIPDTDTPTVGGSPWTYANANYYSQDFIVVRGSGISDFEFNRQGVSNSIGFIGDAPFTLTIDPGDTVTITYATTTPIVLVIPH